MTWKYANNEPMVSTTGQNTILSRQSNYEKRHTRCAMNHNIKWKKKS